MSLLATDLSAVCPWCGLTQPPAVMYDMWARLTLDRDLMSGWVRTGWISERELCCPDPRRLACRCGVTWTWYAGLVTRQEPSATPQQFSTDVGGSLVRGVALTTPWGAWAREREEAGYYVPQHCPATGDDIAETDMVVLVDGKGSPIGGSFELPLSTVQRLGFGDAVHAALATILHWRQKREVLVVVGNDVWQPYAGCDDPFSVVERRSVW